MQTSLQCGQWWGFVRKCSWLRSGGAVVTVKEEKEPHPKFGSGIKTGDEAHIPRSLKRPVTYIMRLSARLQVRAFGKGWGCPAWQ